MGRTNFRVSSDEFPTSCALVDFLFLGGLFGPRRSHIHDHHGDDQTRQNFQIDAPHTTHLSVRGINGWQYAQYYFTIKNDCLHHPSACCRRHLVLNAPTMTRTTAPHSLYHRTRQSTIACYFPHQACFQPRGILTRPPRTPPALPVPRSQEWPSHRREGPPASAPRRQPIPRQRYRSDSPSCSGNLRRYHPVGACASSREQDGGTTAGWVGQPDTVTPGRNKQHHHILAQRVHTHEPG